MRVLTVSTYDIAGGASKSSYRLHQALLENGIDAHLLVQSKFSNDHSVIQFGNKFEKKLSNVKPFIDYLPIRLYKNRTETLFSPSLFNSNKLVKKINDLNPDIVHLQWVQGGMINVKDLPKINSPIVWGLNDMWAFTGGCHYDENCGRFVSKCGKCKVLGSNRANDLSFRILNKKQKNYSKIKNLTVVGHSKWLADLAKTSSVFSGTTVKNLPTPIDMVRFSRFSKEHARSLFNLPQNKKLILFGAMGPTSNPRKGYKQLMSALQNIHNTEADLVIFGSGPPKDKENSSFKIHYIPRLNDELSLQILYNAADVLVVPSLQENLSNIILESMSCGLPVVAFNIGGNGDMIKHKETGYLARNLDTDDLSNGIKWVLNHKEFKTLSDAAINRINDLFSYNAVAKAYIELYQSILAKNLES
jgi:glycosyltransferase involved in cell wall biosynthesis